MLLLSYIRDNTKGGMKMSMAPATRNIITYPSSEAKGDIRVVWIVNVHRCGETFDIRFLNKFIIVYEIFLNQYYFNNTFEIGADFFVDLVMVLTDECSFEIDEKTCFDLVSALTGENTLVAWSEFCKFPMNTVVDFTLCADGTAVLICCRTWRTGP